MKVAISSGVVATGSLVATTALAATAAVAGARSKRLRPMVLLGAVAVACLVVLARPATRVWRDLFPDLDTLFSESIDVIRRHWAQAEQGGPP